MNEPVGLSIESTIDLGSGTDVRARAAFFGLDYDDLVRTSNRLMSVTAVLLIPMILTLETVGLLIIEGTPGELLLGLILGISLALSADLMVLFVVFLSALIMRKAPLLVRQSIANLIATAVRSAVLFYAVSQVPEDLPADLLGLLCGVVGGSAFPILAHTNFVRRIRRGRSGLAAMVEQFRELPTELTIMGGRIGWLLAWVVAEALGKVVVVLLFWFHPWTFIPVLVLTALADVWSVNLALRRKQAQAIFIGSAVTFAGGVALLVL